MSTTARFGTPNRSATSARSAAFALPSTGATASLAAPTEIAAKVAATLDACAAIEIVHSRFENGGAGVSNLEKLADSISNGGLVVGPALADWRGLDFTTIDVPAVCPVPEAEPWDGPEA